LLFDFRQLQLSSGPLFSHLVKWGSCMIELIHYWVFSHSIWTGGHFCDLRPADHNCRGCHLWILGTYQVLNKCLQKEWIWFEEMPGKTQ
jgi:hypothetical protein